ncbi:protease inhibitor I42 family protein [Sinomonas sp.]|jgi:predicted secreted protein|uniref:protease inhibitor I42 family protein n=1 Tax=Sinomonas sp. TaxID=1914986 RepID=UPI003F7EC2AA
MESADSREGRDVDAGAEFDVVLTAPGGTGFRWEVEVLSEGMTLVAEHPRTATEGAAPGSPSSQRFLLRAGTESGAVVFQLRRPWEALPVRRHAVDVRVRR